MHIISNEVDCMQDCRSWEGRGGNIPPFRFWKISFWGKIMPNTLLLPFLRPRYIVAYITPMKLQSCRNRWGQILKNQATNLNQGKLIMPTISILAPLPHGFSNLPTALS